MKRLFSLVLCLFCSLLLNAQQAISEGETKDLVLKRIVRLYDVKKSYVIVFDYSEGDFLGNSFKEFTERLKKLSQEGRKDFDDEAMLLMKSNTFNDEELPPLIKQYENEFYKKGFMRDTPENRNLRPFYVKIKVKSVTPLAGIEATWQLVYEDEKYKAFTSEANIDIKDGRWNTFSNLFTENANKQASKFWKDYSYNVYYLKKKDFQLKLK